MPTLAAAALCLALFAFPRLCLTQTPTPIASMGQPLQWEPFVTGSALFAEHRTDPLLSGSVHHPVTNPVTGLLGLSGEGWLRWRTDLQRMDPGLGLLATSRVVGLSAGIDWDARAHATDLHLAFQTAIRRGGILGRGTMVRADWTPVRDALAIGIQMPIAQHFAGRSRHRDTDEDLAGLTPLPRDLPPTRASPTSVPLAQLQDAARTILAYTDLFPDQHPAVRYGESFGASLNAYHRALVELFGDTIAARARRNVLDAVVLPYDRLFGQVKTRALEALLESAQGRFAIVLRDSLRISEPRRAELLALHASWLGVFRDAERLLRRQWGDSRLVWLPVQLALIESEYDEQAEVDALIERATNARFTDANAVAYLRSTELTAEIARSILAARDYHVLRTHDFTGRRDLTKEVDNVGYTMVADAYFPALTQAVRRYDSTGALTTYILMIDAFFYEKRDGRLWMSMLENPLHARIALPRGAGNAERVAHLRARQDELRAAVRTSRLAHVEDVVKVHVSIVSPSDFSFRSHRIVPGLPFIPDNTQRDHVKVALYDIDESDPYRGAAIVMGVGVGEHYASATWEDRGYRVRGPAALAARDATREALKRNGLRPIPDVLMPALTDSSAADSLRRRVQTDYLGRAIQLYNDVGFGQKGSTVARAMLYSLAPAGSVIIVPDPLWVSHSWAAMLAGAAARGCRVYIISPSQVNSPNPETVIRATQNDVMTRLLALKERLAPQIARAGGELRIGLFTGRAPVTDVDGRLREVRDGIARAPWIRSVFPFDSATLRVLDNVAQRAEGGERANTRLAKDERPRAPLLHQKTQLIARPGAIAALLRQPGWQKVVAPEVDTSETRRTDELLVGFERSLNEAERKAVSFYFSTGSQNMDPRGLMQDGEGSVIVSGPHAASGFVDLYYVMARTTWVASKAELDRLLPEPGGLTRLLARLARPLL